MFHRIIFSAGILLVLWGPISSGLQYYRYESMSAPAFRLWMVGMGLVLMFMAHRMRKKKGFGI